MSAISPWLDLNPYSNEFTVCGMCMPTARAICESAYSPQVCDCVGQGFTEDFCSQNQGKSIEVPVLSCKDPSKKYQVFGTGDPVTWWEARDYCAAIKLGEHRGVLAKINNSDDNRLYRDIVDAAGHSGGRAWIGATDEAWEG